MSSDLLKLDGLDRLACTAATVLRIGTTTAIPTATSPAPLAALRSAFAFNRYNRASEKMRRGLKYAIKI